MAPALPVNGSAKRVLSPPVAPQKKCAAAGRSRRRADRKRPPLDDLAPGTGPIGAELGALVGNIFCDPNLHILEELGTAPLWQWLDALYHVRSRARPVIGERIIERVAVPIPRLVERVRIERGHDRIEDFLRRGKVDGAVAVIIERVREAGHPAPEEVLKGLFRKREIIADALREFSRGLEAVRVLVPEYVAQIVPLRSRGGFREVGGRLDLVGPVILFAVGLNIPPPAVLHVGELRFAEVEV